MDAAPVVRSFLRFSLPAGGPIQRATLRIHAETANRAGFSIRNTTGSWSEQGVTHANAPAVGAVVGSSGRVAAGQDVEVDVTSAAQPGGTLDLAMTTTSTTNTRFTSREGGAKGPRLVLLTGADGGTGADPGGAGTSREATHGGRDRRLAAGGAHPGRLLLPWYPQAWRQHAGTRSRSTGRRPATTTRARPSDRRPHRRHAPRGHQAGISSWWGRGTPTDLRVPRLLQAAAGKPFRWSVYHEGEGQGDPSVSELTADLTHLRDRYGHDPSYLRIDGRFVVFAYGATETCDMVDRWRQANTVGAYVVLKVFSGYRSCPAQPDGWHQYGPAIAASSHLPIRHRLARVPQGDRAHPPAGPGPGPLEQVVTSMAASTARFHLVSTFNEWGEGTAVESAASWPSSSGYGQYLDVLHRVAATTPSSGSTTAPFLSGSSDPVIAAVGDSACDPADANFKGGAGGRSSCHHRAVSDLLVNRNLAAFLPLGDNQYEDGTLAKFLASYEPTFGRLKTITRPVVGNHEYLTAGAAGYFDYFGSQAGQRGQGWYSYDLGRWHLVALNSNCGQAGGCGPDSPQGRWLRADLAASRAPAPWPTCTIPGSLGHHGARRPCAAVEALYDAVPRSW